MKRKVSLFLVFLLLMWGTTAKTEGDDTLHVGVVYKQSDSAYFNAAMDGFKKASEELGFHFVHDGPDDGSSGGQIQIIENYINQGVDAICISANDPDALEGVLQKAMGKGIKVISWDTGASTKSRNLDIKPASDKVIALTLVESIAKSIDFEGRLAIVSGAVSGSGRGNLWIDFIEEALANDEAYAKMEHVGVIYGDDDYSKTYDETARLIGRYPDLKGIIVLSTTGAPAVAQCVLEADMGIKVTGLTLASDMAGYVKTGVCDETFLWNPTELGYAASYAAIALCRGEITGAVGESYEVPGIGVLTIEEWDEAESPGDMLPTDGTVSYLNKLNKFTAVTVDDWVDIL